MGSGAGRASAFDTASAKHVFARKGRRSQPVLACQPAFLERILPRYREFAGVSRVQGRAEEICFDRVSESVECCPAKHLGKLHRRNGSAAGNTAATGAILFSKD